MVRAREGTSDISRCYRREGQARREKVPRPIDMVLMCQYLSKTSLATSAKQSCRAFLANGYKRTALVLRGPPLGFCMGSSSHVGLLWSIYVGSSLNVLSVSSSNTSSSLDPPL